MFKLWYIHHFEFYLHIKLWVNLLYILLNFLEFVFFLYRFYILAEHKCSCEGDEICEGKRAVFFFILLFVITVCITGYKIYSILRVTYCSQWLDTLIQRRVEMKTFKEQKKTYYDFQKKRNISIFSIIYHSLLIINGTCSSFGSTQNLWHENLQHFRFPPHWLSDWHSEALIKHCKGCGSSGQSPLFGSENKINILF